MNPIGISTGKPKTRFSSPDRQNPQQSLGEQDQHHHNSYHQEGGDQSSDQNRNNPPRNRRRQTVDIKVFVGQIPKQWDENELKTFFEKYGEVLRVQVLRDKSGMHKGCAFIIFASILDANEAIERLRQYRLPGMHNPVQIKWADNEVERFGIRQDQEHVLYVAQIPKTVNEGEVREVFSKYGRVKEVDIPRDQSGWSRGYIFVKFSNIEESLLAKMNLHDTRPFGDKNQALVVRFYDPKKKLGLIGFPPTMDGPSSGPPPPPYHRDRRSNSRERERGGFGREQSLHHHRDDFVDHPRDNNHRQWNDREEHPFSQGPPSRGPFEDKYHSSGPSPRFENQGHPPSRFEHPSGRFDQPPTRFEHHRNRQESPPRGRFDQNQQGRFPPGNGAPFFPPNTLQNGPPINQPNGSVSSQRPPYQPHSAPTSHPNDYPPFTPQPGGNQFGPNQAYQRAEYPPADVANPVAGPYQAPPGGQYNPHYHATQTSTDTSKNGFNGYRGAPESHQPPQQAVTQVPEVLNQPQPAAAKVYYKYFTSDKTPYYYDTVTLETSYEIPPLGSLVYTPDVAGEQTSSQQSGEQASQQAQSIAPSTSQNQGNMYPPQSQQMTPVYQSQQSQVPPQYQHQQQGQMYNQKQPSEMSRGTTGPVGANLFVMHLPNEFREQDLANLFTQIPGLISHKVVKGSDGLSKGYGFVSFNSVENAAQAISQVNGLQVGKKKLKVEIKKGENEDSSNRNYGGFHPL